LAGGLARSARGSVRPTPAPPHRSSHLRRRERDPCQSADAHWLNRVIASSIAPEIPCSDFAPAKRNGAVAVAPKPAPRYLRGSGPEPMLQKPIAFPFEAAGLSGAFPSSTQRSATMPRRIRVRLPVLLVVPIWPRRSTRTARRPRAEFAKRVDRAGRRIYATQ